MADAKGLRDHFAEDECEERGDASRDADASVAERRDRPGRRERRRGDVDEGVPDEDGFEQAVRVGFERLDEARVASFLFDKRRTWSLERLSIAASAQLKNAERKRRKMKRRSRPDIGESTLA